MRGGQLINTAIPPTCNDDDEEQEEEDNDDDGDDDDDNNDDDDNDDDDDDYHHHHHHHHHNHDDGNDNECDVAIVITSLALPQCSTYGCCNKLPPTRCVSGDVKPASNVLPGFMCNGSSNA